MREKIMLISMATVAVVAVGMLFLIGQTSPSALSAAKQSEPAVVIVPVTKLVQGMQSGIAVRANYLITSAADLTKLWKMIGATSTPPVVDFTKDTVLAVFAGDEPSLAIAVAKVEDTTERLVSITITRPDGTCTTKKPITSPYEIVTVPTTPLPITHEDIDATTSCSK
jgi:hypothetical protein